MSQNLIKKHALSSCILFTSFLISLPSVAYVISQEEAMTISQELAKGGRVKITCRGIKMMEEDVPPIPLPSSSTLSTPLVASNEITFDSHVHLTWEGKGILEIEALKDIIFKEGALISNHGKGGLRLVSREGTIQFASPEPQIDFENSEGALSIFYNPIGTDEEKYKHPKDFKSHIKIDPLKVFYRAFMFIHNDTDLENMEANPHESYALSCDLGEIFFRDLKRMSRPFAGTFNFNGIRFLSKTYCDGYRDHKRNAFVRTFVPHPCIVSHVFEQCLEEDWGENTFYLAPPLDKDRSRLLTSLDYGDEETAIELIEKMFHWSSDLSAVGKLVFFEGTGQNTPLHIAAEKGLTKSLQVMLSKVFAHFLSEHRIRHGSDTIYCSPDDYNKYLQRGPFSLLGRKNADGFRVIDLAVRQGHIETAGEIISHYHRYNMHSFLGKGLLIDFVRQQEESPLESFTEMMALLENFQEPPLRFDGLLEGFPITEQAREAEYRRQLRVGWRFFMRPPGTTRTCQIFGDFTVRYQPGATPFPIFNLEGISSRSRIILLQAITNHKLQTYISQNPALKQAYWLDTEERIDDEKTYIQSVDRFPVAYKFGGLTHTIKNMPTTHKPGYAYYHEIGKYEGICQILTEIEKSIPSQKIAKLSHRSRISGKSITTQKLKTKGYVDREGGNPQEDAAYLNRINFLLDLEIACRLVNRSPSLYDLLPVSGANARAFFLQRKGLLSLADLLNKASPYHPYSDTEGSSQRERAIKGINDKSHETANEGGIHYDEAITRWQKLHPIGLIIKTSEGLHQELLEEFGGDYESSGEEYPEF